MAQSTPYDAPAGSAHVMMDREGDSTGGLLRRLFEDLSTLFRQEIALARSELTSSMNAAKAGAASMALGGAVLFSGFLVLLSALVLLLGQTMELWLAALIVGLVVAGIGFAMLQAGRKKLEPAGFVPERTQESLRKDKDVIQNRRPS